MTSKSSRTEQKHSRQQISSQEQGEITESPVSLGNAIPNNITISIAQPTKNPPQKAVIAVAERGNPERLFFLEKVMARRGAQIVEEETRENNSRHLRARQIIFEQD